MSEWSDIGAMLHGEREALGWSLRDVSHSTRIPVQTLHELEENDYTGFPSPAYAKSFLAQYCNYLGIDAGDWLDAFDTGNVLSNLDSYGYLKGSDEHLGEETIPKRIPKRKAAPAAAPVSAPAPASGSGSALQPLFVFLATALLITGGAFGFLHLSNRLSGTVGPEGGQVERTDPTLSPAPSVVPSRPARPRHPAPPLNAAPAVAGTSSGPLDIRAIRVGEDSQPKLLLNSPPPRAVIVEE